VLINPASHTHNFKEKSADEFNFQPLDVSKGTGLQTILNSSYVSSWGGLVLYDKEDNEYYMWAAEMTEETGIKAWITNSQVVHVVADPTSDRPFEFIVNQ
jgi:hypothetical protein